MISKIKLLTTSPFYLKKYTFESIYQYRSMELSEHNSFKKCKCKERVHDDSCKSCKIRCSASDSRQYGHCSIYSDRRDEENPEKHRTDMGYRNCRDKERTKYQIEDGSGSECSEDERRNNNDRLGCKGHRCEKRSKYWREAETDSYPRGRSMSREKSADSHNFPNFRWTSCRHSGSRRTRRNRTRAVSRSSSEESSCGVLDGLCMKRNSTSKHDYNNVIDEAEKRRQNLNSACKHQSFLERRAYVTKHSYSQCFHGNITCCCNIHSCCSRKRKWKYYSSESDEDTANVGKANHCCQLQHGHCCHGELPSFHCNVNRGMPCKDSVFGLNGTTSTKCQKILPERRSVWSPFTSPCAGDHTQSQDVSGIRPVNTFSEPKEGSSYVIREKNKIWSSCAVGKANFDAGKTKDQEKQDQWLELSLNTWQRSELKVEGASKNDLKLSLPDSIGEPNAEGLISSRLPDTGLHSSRESMKHVGVNELPFESSHINFSVWSHNADPCSLPQEVKESIPCLSFVQAPAMPSNLNLPKSILNMGAGTTPPIIYGKSVSGFDQNCHYSHTTRIEPQHTVPAENILGSSGVSEDRHNSVPDHVVLPNQSNELPPNLSSLPHIEERRVLCPADSLFKAISTDGAADCGVGDECNASELLQSKRTKEFSGSALIIDDSEDDCSEQSSFHGLHERKKFVGSSGNISVTREISDDDKENYLHERKNSYIQGTSLSKNILCAGMKEFDLEYRTVSLANAQKKDEVENGVNIRGTLLSQACENIGECAGSDDQLAEDKCRTIEVISSEDESIDNNAQNVTLQCKNGTLQESEGNTWGDCVILRGTDCVVLSDWETLSHKNMANCGVVDSIDKDSVIDVQFHKKLVRCPSDDNGNAEAVFSSRGISSTLDSKRLYLPFVEALIQFVKSKPRAWDTGILCDLCGQGPSLIYGEWYAWCCGYRLLNCKCTEDHQRKLKLSLNPKSKKPSKRWAGHQWSGKVHRMCGIWSSEVFEKDDGKDKLEGLFNAVKRGRNLVFEKDDGKDKLEGLFNAVKRGRNLDCKDPECRRFGATLGCRVKNCRRSYHYPCAVKLASKLRCRIWEGCRRPVACHLHRHVVDDCVSAKEWQSHWSYGKKLVNPAMGNRNTTIYSETQRAHQNMPDNIILIEDFSSDDDDQATAEEYEKINERGRKEKIVNQIYDGNRLERDGITLGRIVQDGTTLQFLGNNLICEDLSHGMEAIKIPCTNDIDNAPVPSFEYITSSKYSEHANAILKTVLANVKKQAKPCSGCYEIDMDDPKASISVHIDVKEGRRNQDRQIDWQGEPMLGRLPYDRYGLLQLGWLTIDVRECNSRCHCGSKCVNRELQKGLQHALEVFKTEDRGWGVRTLEQIPRGKFVVEYVGEVVTQREASNRGQVYAEYNSSYLCNLDHPAVAQEDHLVLDGFKMSNVARFINHSCEGNLRLYRVYTETLDHRIFRIGLYACCDIEIGEELTYDYKFIQEEPPLVSIDEPPTLKCFCGAKTCRQVLLA